MTHSAGMAATIAGGRMMETRNAVSPGRKLRAMITKAGARIPATIPCTIGPSHRRRAGEAKIKATRMKRAFDTFRRMAVATADHAPDKLLTQARGLMRR